MEHTFVSLHKQGKTERTGYGRVPSPFSHLQASLRGKRTFDTDIYKLFYLNLFNYYNEIYPLVKSEHPVFIVAFKNSLWYNVTQFLILHLVFFIIPLLTDQ